MEISAGPIWMCELCLGAGIKVQDTVVWSYAHAKKMGKKNEFIFFSDSFKSPTDQ